MTDPTPAPVPDFPLILAAIDNALRNGSYMTGANLAFEMLCDQLDIDRDSLEFRPGWASEVRATAAASSVPTGTRADRWWTHGSCGPAPGNADGPRWTSCVGCGRPVRDLQWQPYPTPDNPANGDDSDD